MRHLDPRQPKPLAQDEQRPARRRRSLWPLAAGVLAVALAGGWGLTHVYPPVQTDQVTQAEVQKREQAFRNAGAIPLAVVPSARTDVALAAMKLPNADKEALRKDLATPGQPARSTNPATAPAQQQPVKLVELVLWDTDAADGDVVRVLSGGFAQDVPLAKSPAVVLVPYSGAAVQVVGVRDGGGGITLGVRGSDNTLLMPVMSEGQVLSLPVRLQ